MRTPPCKASVSREKETERARRACTQQHSTHHPWELLAVAWRDGGDDVAAVSGMLSGRVPFGSIAGGGGGRHFHIVTMPSVATIVAVHTTPPSTPVAELAASAGRKIAWKYLRLTSCYVFDGLYYYFDCEKKCMVRGLAVRREHACTSV